jgi:hypothetical protein
MTPTKYIVLGTIGGLIRFDVRYIEAERFYPECEADRKRALIRRQVSAKLGPHSELFGEFPTWDRRT